MSAWLHAQLCNGKAGNESPGKALYSRWEGEKNSQWEGKKFTLLDMMWIEGAELGRGTLRGGREPIGKAVPGIPAEEILKICELVQFCALEALLEEG